jgi:S-adenosylmethionine synthetase
MTFQQQTNVVDEKTLQSLSSENGLLIGYSIDEYENMFPTPNAAIRFINNLPAHERKELRDEEVIIYKNQISPKNTVYGEDDYTAIKGEIIETTEHVQFNRKTKVWR